MKLFRTYWGQIRATKRRRAIQKKTWIQCSDMYKKIIAETEKKHIEEMNNLKLIYDMSVREVRESERLRYEGRNDAIMLGTRNTVTDEKAANAERIKYLERRNDELLNLAAKEFERTRNLREREIFVDDIVGRIERTVYRVQHETAQVWEIAAVIKTNWDKYREVQKKERE